MTPPDETVDVLLGQLREALGQAVEVDRMRNMQLNMSTVLSRAIEVIGQLRADRDLVVEENATAARALTAITDIAKDTQARVDTLDADMQVMITANERLANERDALFEALQTANTMVQRHEATLDAYARLPLPPVKL